MNNKPATFYGAERNITTRVNSLEELVEFVQRHTLINHVGCTFSELVNNSGNWNYFNVDDKYYDYDDEDSDRTPSVHDLHIELVVDIIHPNEFMESTGNYIPNVTITIINPKYVTSSVYNDFPALVSLYTVDSFDRTGNVEACMLEVLPLSTATESIDGVNFDRLEVDWRAINE